MKNLNENNRNNFNYFAAKKNDLKGTIYTKISLN